MDTHASGISWRRIILSSSSSLVLNSLLNAHINTTADYPSRPLHLTKGPPPPRRVRQPLSNVSLRKVAHESRLRGGGRGGTHDLLPKLDPVESLLVAASWQRFTRVWDGLHIMAAVGRNQPAKGMQDPRGAGRASRRQLERPHHAAGDLAPRGGELPNKWHGRRGHRCLRGPMPGLEPSLRQGCQEGEIQ